MKRIKKIERELAAPFFGNFDENVRALEKELGVIIAGRGNEVIIKGARKKVLRAQAAIEERLANITDRKAVIAAEPASATGGDENKRIEVGSKRQFVFVQSPGQKEYIEAIRREQIVVGIGPAGTGKTYLAVATAIERLRARTVERIVITRPAIEAGERLGFLPGDLEEKIRPYLQPIYDALYDLVWPEEIRRWVEHRIIEILPLAYMRGRTLADAFVILDEAQNATPEQMKMFLTRLGVGSRAVVTGDITQSDLPAETVSGLEDITAVLKGIRGIRFVYFAEADVVRHPLVREIIRAYEEERQKRRSLLAQPATKDRPKRKGRPATTRPDS